LSHRHPAFLHLFFFCPHSSPNSCSSTQRPTLHCHPCGLPFPCGLPLLPSPPSQSCPCQTLITGSYGLRPRCGLASEPGRPRPADNGLGSSPKTPVLWSTARQSGLLGLTMAP
jgi:hypothetical protein